MLSGFQASRTPILKQLTQSLIIKEVRDLQLRDLWIARHKPIRIASLQVRTKMQTLLSLEFQAKNLTSDLLSPMAVTKQSLKE